jgi:hypothetical protein
MSRIFDASCTPTIGDVCLCIARVWTVVYILMCIKYKQSLHCIDCQIKCIVEFSKQQAVRSLGIFQPKAAQLVTSCPCRVVSTYLVDLQHGMFPPGSQDSGIEGQLISLSTSTPPLPPTLNTNPSPSAAFLSTLHTSNRPLLTISSLFALSFSASSTHIPGANLTTGTR